MIDLRDQHDVAAEKRDATDDGGFGISGVATPMQDESRAPCRPERGEEENEFHQLGDFSPVGGDEAHGGKTDQHRAKKGQHLRDAAGGGFARSAEHTSELQSLMRISYAVFRLKKITHHYFFLYSSFLTSYLPLITITSPF